MPRGPRVHTAEPLTLAEAPDVLDTRQIARIMHVGLNYAAQLVREDFLVNLGGRMDYAVPKASVAKLLEDVSYGRVTLPVRRKGGRPPTPPENTGDMSEAA
jgi:hypothetical protein